MIDRRTFVKKIVPLGRIPAIEETTAFSPSNIALCKYWGKKNGVLNLPTTPSLSISLGNRGSFVKLSLSSQNSLSINTSLISPDSVHFARTFDFLNLFFAPDIKVAIQTHNNIPTAAGLASSASYFSALTLALNQLYDWQLPLSTLSCLARLGSGSACRSLYQGFVQWIDSDDPFKSYGIPLTIQWPEFRVGLLIFDAKPKLISSRQAMHQTQLTSPFYQTWCENSHNDFKLLHAAIEKKNFTQVGEISEYNALSLHAAMLAARPPIIYSQPETIHALSKVHTLRHSGIEVYATQDAGPNLKLLFLEKDCDAIQEVFPKVEIINPFDWGV